MQVLEDALKRLLYKQGFVPPDFARAAYSMDTAPGIVHQNFQSKQLFIWYDYFSVPQCALTCMHNEQSNAIQSIPAYIARCRFFFALCPTLDSPFQGQVLSTASWARRRRDHFDVNVLFSVVLFFLWRFRCSMVFRLPRGS